MFNPKQSVFAATLPRCPSVEIGGPQGTALSLRGSGPTTICYQTWFGSPLSDFRQTFVLALRNFWLTSFK